MRIQDRYKRFCNQLDKIDGIIMAAEHEHYVIFLIKLWYAFAYFVGAVALTLFDFITDYDETRIERAKSNTKTNYEGNIQVAPDVFNKFGLGTNSGMLYAHMDTQYFKSGASRCPA